jgi:hypothetical protein
MAQASARRIREILTVNLRPVKIGVFVLAVWLVLPGVAFAHGGESQHGFSSTINFIQNARGIDAQASGDGHFTFTAPPGHTVVVTGYSGEPYLRFRAGKIDENERAPTTFVNRDAPPSPRADAKAAPEWHQVATGLRYTWHDHRTHWMASQPPAIVRDAPHVPHHIFDWKVTGTVDARPFSIVGSLDWGPTKSGPGYLWISYLVIGFGAVYAGFLLFSKRRTKQQRRLGADDASRRT